MSLKFHILRITAQCEHRTELSYNRIESYKGFNINQITFGRRKILET